MKMNEPQVLALDIESAPILAHTWGLRDLNVGINQIISDPYIMGVGHSFNHKPAKYISTWDDGGRLGMLGQVHSLLDRADVVIGWNSQGFDVKWLNGEFIREGLTPPSPFKQIDLMKVARANFRFPSFKLDYVAGALLGEHKLSTGGHGLWIACMNGDEKARRKMATYCRQDVNLLWPLLEHMRPWMGNQFNFGMWSDEPLACQKCGSATFLVPKGTAYTATRSYKQFWCKPAEGGCGGWTRDSRSTGSTQGTGVIR